MRERFGNLVREDDLGFFYVILHGCNCQATMGAGIAKTIKDRWPEVYEFDKNTYDAGMAKLGRFGSVVVKTRTEKDLIVVNCYTQEFPGGSIRPVNYEAIASCFEKVNEKFKGMDFKIGIPLIGCGLAGGNWNIVKTMAQELMPDLKVTVIHFPTDNYTMQVAIHGQIDVIKGNRGDEICYTYEGETFLADESALYRYDFDVK